MGFYISAGTTILLVAFMITAGVLTTSIVPTVKEFNYSFDDYCKRIADKRQTDIKIMGASEECENETWWDLDWNYRKIITIDHTKVEGNLTNFPSVT